MSPLDMIRELHARARHCDPAYIGSQLHRDVAQYLAQQAEKRTEVQS